MSEVIRSRFFYYGIIVALIVVTLIYMLYRKNRVERRKQEIKKSIEFARKCEINRENDEEIKKLTYSIGKESRNTTICRNLIVYVGVLLSVYGYYGGRISGMRELAAKMLGSDTIWNERYLAAELLLASALKHLYNNEGGALAPVKDIIDKKPDSQNKYGFYANSAVIDLAFSISGSLYNDDVINEKVWRLNSEGFKEHLYRIEEN